MEYKLWVVPEYNSECTHIEDIVTNRGAVRKTYIKQIGLYWGSKEQIRSNAGEHRLGSIEVSLTENEHEEFYKRIPEFLEKAVELYKEIVLRA